jgi:multicomponent Na+:H+ antiporter subunit D
MGVGALLLAALPPFTTFMGKSMLEAAASAAGGYGWLIAVFVFISAVTGGAVLRVVGRVFLGLGASQGPHPEQAQAAEEADETEGSRDHTPALMVIVPAALLLGVLVLGLVPGAVPGAERFAAQFVDHSNYQAWVLHGAHVALPELEPSHVSVSDYAYGAASIAGAILVAALGLFAPSAREQGEGTFGGPVHATAGVVRALHSGHIGDYIAWWSLGASIIGGVCLVALR